MIKFNCYCCDKVRWLFSDSRCADCTHLTPEEVSGQLWDHTDAANMREL